MSGGARTPGAGLPSKPRLTPPKRPNRGRGLSAGEAADWLDEALAHFYAVVYREEWFAVMGARTTVIDAMDRLAHAAQPRVIGEHGHNLARAAQPGDGGDR